MVETPKDEKEFGYGRVAFLAHSAAISTQLSTGRMKKPVWREYRDRLGGLGYLQFLRYVARYIPHHSLKAADAASPRTAPPRAQTEPREPLGAGTQTEKRGFHFDPMDAIRNKDKYV